MGSRILKDPTTANCRIFVGHLQTDDMNKNELEAHFSKYGVIIGSSMNRGFGFVQFENEMAAQSAIQNENGQMLKGRRIDVKPAKKDGGGGRGGGGMNDNSKSENTNNQFSPRNNQYRNNSFGGGNQNQNQPSPQKNQSNYGGNSSSNQQNFSSSSSSTPSQKPAESNQFEEKPKDNNCPPASTEEFSDNNKNQQDDTDVQMIESFNGNQSRDSNDSFNSQNQSNRGGNNQTNRQQDEQQSGNQSSNSTGANSTGNTNDNSPNNGQNRGNSQNRSNANNSNSNNNTNSNNRNQNNGNNQGNSSGRTRGSRGGKNRGKNRENSGGGGGNNNNNNSNNNYRDRSPLNRGGNRSGNDDKRDWDHNRMQRGNNDYGPRSQQFNNDMNTGMRFDDRFNDTMPQFGRSNNIDYPGMPTGVPDKNDCEIIVVSKLLTEYAEAIELRLKKIGLTVDLLFPNEEVPLSRVLGNIASRGCLYAVVITPINLERHSMTLNILHGVPQEHRNMTVDDALNLIARDFGNYKSGDRSVPLNVPFTADRHPDAIQVLLNILVNNHQLTVLQYDRLLKYLEIKREEQVQIELGDVKDVPATTITVADPKHAELQSRILNILNSSKGNSNNESNTLSVSMAGLTSTVTATTTPSTPVSTPALLASSTPAPAPVPPANNWTTGSTSMTTSTTSTTSTGGVTPSPLLNDPTVQKALDSLLQGNLLKNIGGESTPAATPQPLFAAFPNINRF